MIVIDASVLADFLLGRDQAVDGVQEAMIGREHEFLHAPELIELEVLNTLRRLTRAGTITKSRATEAVNDIASVRLARYPHAPLRERVWALRENLTAYDAAYLALAEALDDPLLLTGDSALAGIARGSLGADRVRHTR